MGSNWNEMKLFNFENVFYKIAVRNNLQQKSFHNYHKTLIKISGDVFSIERRFSILIDVLNIGRGFKNLTMFETFNDFFHHLMTFEIFNNVFSIK